MIESTQNKPENPHSAWGWVKNIALPALAVGRLFVDVLVFLQNGGWPF